MRITIYDNSETYVPDKLIGFVGETNHRTIEFEYTEVTGATNYEFRLLYPDGTAYLAPIVNRAVTVTGSMLPAAGRIKGQWLAYAVDSNEEYTLVAKSEMFELIIGASIGDDAAPVPTYEATLSVVQQMVENGMTREQMITAIEQIVETGEVTDLDSGFVTTLKEKNHGAGLSVFVGTTAEINAVSPKEANTLYIPTDDDTGWLDLTLTEGWTVKSFDDLGTEMQQTPQYRRIGNHVYIRGCICKESISDNLAVHKTYAYLPEGFRPTRFVFRSTTGAGLTVSRIETNPSGELFTRCVFDLATSEKKTTCDWMSIEMDFLID